VSHTCAIKPSDGTVYCLGRNDQGQLGTGEVAGPDEPDGLTWSQVLVSAERPLEGAISLAAGVEHTCAATALGALCWGGSSRGQAGLSAQAVPWATEIAFQGRINAGLVSQLASGWEHVCLEGAGRFLCWGSNEYAQLSGGLAETVVPPIAFASLSIFQQLALGDRFSLGPLPSGAVRCWGRNDSGEIGVDPGPDCPPNCVQGVTEVAGVIHAEQLALGSIGSCALVGGEVLCWGEGSVLGSDQPIKVPHPTPVRVLAEDGNPLTGVEEVEALGDRVCAIARGEVYCWRSATRAVHLPW
jgi:Regulator of chromosome condensation (RCC1) repeat